MTGGIVTHAEPVGRARTNHIHRLAADQPPAEQFEQIWTYTEDQQTFELCCIPFFPYGVSLGDRITINEDGSLARLPERFPNLVPPPIDPAGWTAWEAADGSAAIELNWSPQYLVATPRGSYTNDQMNWIIGICVDVADGRLYDPQTGERFDSH